MTFDDFWAVYPRRVAKLDAQKAFAKALKIAPAEDIIAGARRYAAGAREPQFTKHPATWLRSGCWMDEEMTPTPTNGVAAQREKLRQEIEQDQRSETGQDSRSFGRLQPLDWEEPRRPH